MSRRPTARGAIAWITGLPASGKSTLGRALARRARGVGLEVALLDGDAVRLALGRPAGRGEAERDAFYAALARLAGLLAGQGLAVVVAATAPRRAHRAGARRAAAAARAAWLEIHVATPAATCARRDPKGLWAEARAGRAALLPGVGSTYAPPRRPGVTARGGRDREALDAALAHLVAAARIRRRATRASPPDRARRPGTSSAAAAGS